MCEWDDRVQEFVDRATPEERRVWEDFKRRQEATLHRQGLWVRRVGALAGGINKHGPRPDWRTLELFWLRLFGVLHEFGGSHASQLRFLGRAEPDEGPVLRWLRTLEECAASILRPLSEPEVIVVDWLRQRSAHVFPRGYGLQPQKDKARVKEERGVELLGNKTLTIEETDTARESVLQQYGGDEVAMQVALARKTAPAVSVFVLMHQRSLGALTRLGS